MPLRTITEYGARFETGTPVEFTFQHNTDSAPPSPPGDPYEQSLEPAGMYVLHAPPGPPPPPPFVEGVANLESPLVLAINETEGEIYGPGSWKRNLADAYGATGHALTEAILDDGYDGVVTVQVVRGTPYTSEIVLLDPERSISRRRPNYAPEDVPDKYIGKLKGKQAKKRRKEISRRSKKDTDDPKAYRPFKTDIDPKTGKKRKTKPSKYTKRYHDLYGEQNAGSVAKVAKATGISKKILQEVYDRGLAAWRTGHRPGATQAQWGMARVYSFVTGGKTYETADADLAEKAREGGFMPKKKRKKKNAAVATQLGAAVAGGVASAIATEAMEEALEPNKQANRRRELNALKKRLTKL